MLLPAWATVGLLVVEELAVADLADLATISFVAFGDLTTALLV